MPNDVKITDQQVLFWRGWPSQWAQSPFVLDAVHYGCCEQFMMAEKARVFDDEETLAKILRSTSPREQQALGRGVQNFDLDRWNSVCRGIVYTANLAKFAQNPSLRQLKMATSDRILVEASPVDRIWGIGLGQDDPRSLDESQWLGSNWLGIALMQVRSTLQAETLSQPHKLDAQLQTQLEQRNKFPMG